MGASTVLLLVVLGVPTAFLGFAAWYICKAKPARSIPEIVDGVIKEHAPRIMGPAIQQIVEDEFRNNPRFRFIKWMQWEMQRIDKRLGGEASFNLAKAALCDFLHDEAITFGDVRYGWNEDDAKAIIHSYEIDHWESCP